MPAIVAGVVEIVVHIEPAEYSFNWVDRPILVVIELLEMVEGSSGLCGSGTPAPT